MNFNLFGDGINDDTPAIQQMLDSRDCLVELPATNSGYVISKTLYIHSKQELRLSRYTTVRLLPQSNYCMLANSDSEYGNSDITITGGIWDMNNTEQSPNPFYHLTYWNDKPAENWGKNDTFQAVIWALDFNSQILKNLF